MRYIMLPLLLLSLTAPALANPYAEMSAPEIRRTIADLPKVMQEKWYQIEVVAFARQSPLSDEYWRLDQQPDLNHSALIALDSSEPRIPEHADNIDSSAVAYGAWRVIDSDLPLQQAADRMAKDGHRILLHKAWRQPVRERAHAFAVLVEGGDILPEPVVADETLQDGELPPDTDAYSAMDSSGQFTTMPQIEALESTQEPIAIRELQGALRFHLSRYLHIEPILWFGSDTAEGQRVWVKIDQNRRMRSEELHYLDHPLFGLLVRITPWNHPEQDKLDQLNEALKAQQTR
ncbi:MAG: CsiV family protein [Alcanivoracaceae bacterium]|nr:CsiV family protein [Alcanivoracaceae bacterium]